MTRDMSVSSLINLGLTDLPVIMINSDRVQDYVRRYSWKRKYRALLKTDKITAIKIDVLIKRKLFLGNPLGDMIWVYIDYFSNL